MIRPALLALLLSACSAVVPTTAARLAALDPLTADPAGLAVALVLPPGLEVTPGTAVLALSAERGAQRIGGQFVLEPGAAADLPVADGAQVRVFALTAVDAAAMRDLQREIGLWKAEGPARGSLSVGVGACAVNGGPDPDARAAALIRLAKGEPFRPLIADAPLAALVGAKAMAAIGPCPGSAKAVSRRP